MSNNTVKEVRENSAMFFTKGMFDFFMNKYTSMDMDSYNSDEGKRIFDIIKYNEENVGSYSVEEWQSIVKDLMTKYIKDAKNKGVTLNGPEIVKKFNTSLNPGNNVLVIDSEDLYDNKMNGEKNIFLNIELNSTDVLSSLRQILNKLNEKDLPFCITIPHFSETEKGNTDSIVLAVTEESMGDTISVLKELETTIKDHTKSNDYAKNNWFGIKTIKDGKYADEFLGELFIKTMNDTLIELGNLHPEVLVDGKSIVDTINNSTLKDKARVDAYKALSDITLDINTNIYNKFLSLIQESELSVDNIYVYKSIDEKLNQLYGEINIVKHEVGDKVIEQPTPEVAVPVQEEVIPAPEENTVSEIISEPSVIVNQINVEEIVQPEIETAEEKNDTPSISVDKEEQGYEDSPLSYAQQLSIEDLYEGLLDANLKEAGWSFTSKVKSLKVPGATITLSQYLAFNKVKDKIPFSSSVTLSDGTTSSGKVITGLQFIQSYVLNALNNNMLDEDEIIGVEIQKIIEMYVSRIVGIDGKVYYPEQFVETKTNNKVKFLGKFFKK